jgi:uncharacterized Tic20 family protein
MTDANSAAAHAAPAPTPTGATPPNGKRFWRLLLLFLIPVLGFVVTPIVAVAQRAQTRRSPHELVRENARWAANWALSFVLYVIVLCALMYVIAVVSTGADGTTSPLLTVPWFVLAAVGIYCLVTLTRGELIADRRVHRPALAIPFFRS